VAFTTEFETVPSSRRAPIRSGDCGGAVAEGEACRPGGGHQPTLGQVAGLLLAGEPQEWALRKGAILWLVRRTRGHGSEVVLRAALSPELV